MMSDVSFVSYMVLSVLRSYWFLSLSFRLGVGDLNITVPVKVAHGRQGKVLEGKIERSLHLAVTNTAYLTLTL